LENNDIQAVDENTIIQERRAKLQELRQAGVAFPNHFKPEHLAQTLHQDYDAIDKPGLEEKKYSCRCCGTHDAKTGDG